MLGLPENITQLVVERQGYDAKFLLPEVVSGQQRIADTFTDLKFIQQKLDIKQAVYPPLWLFLPSRAAYYIRMPFSSPRY
ncbi:MAG: hypothetical protein ACSLEN_04630 [Candidatus Malihini olakiniferum]